MTTVLTVMLYAIAIIHCLTDRVIAPFLIALFRELTSEDAPDTDALLALAVVPTPVEPTVVAPVKAARPARRRRSTSKKTLTEVVS